MSFATKFNLVCILLREFGEWNVEFRANRWGKGDFLMILLK
jgi:hypothetical protein